MRLRLRVLVLRREVLLEEWIGGRRRLVGPSIMTGWELYVVARSKAAVRADRCECSKCWLLLALVANSSAARIASWLLGS
jgi:hypothetical protein